MLVLYSGNNAQVTSLAVENVTILVIYLLPITFLQAQNFTMHQQMFDLAITKVNGTRRTASPKMPSKVQKKFINGVYLYVTDEALQLENGNSPYPRLFHARSA